MGPMGLGYHHGLYILFLRKDELFRNEANLWPYVKGVRQNTSIMVIQSVNTV